MLDQRNVLGRAHLTAGIAPIRSLNSAEHLRQLPGVQLPDRVMDRISQAKDVKAEGHQISLELINELKSLRGEQAIHFIAIGDISDLKRMIVESGLK